MEESNNNIVKHLKERGDPLSIWAAQTIRQLRQQNDKLAKKASQNSLTKRADAAENKAERFWDMWRQESRRVSDLINTWRPIAMEIARVYGMGNRFHSINDINEYGKRSSTDPYSIYMKEFTDKGIRTVDVCEAVMAILKKVPNKSWYSRLFNKE